MVDLNGQPVTIVEDLDTAGAIGTVPTSDGAGGLTMAVPGGGVLEKAMLRDYVGDNTNSREIDLGDDYQWVIVRELGNVGSGTVHNVLGWALTDSYNTLYNAGSGDIRSTLGSGANSIFQGKLTGGDANKIKLGTSGASADGLNVSGRNYRILALKFSEVEE